VDVGEEAPGLQWSQIDFKTGIMRLNASQTKNGKPREFPFGILPELDQLLGEQWARTEVWQRQHGQIIRDVFWRPVKRGKDGRPEPRTIRDFRGAWKSAAKAAGKPGTLFHDNRRSTVRRMELAGVPRAVAMKLTGHLTEDVYRRYAIVSQADLAAGVAKIAAYQGRKTGAV
jgi:integrase